MKDTEKIQEVLRYIGENYVHRIVGGIFPAMSQGLFVGIPGTVEASMSVLCKRTPRFSPAMFLGANRKIGQCAWCGFAH